MPDRLGGGATSTWLVAAWIRVTEPLASPRASRLACARRHRAAYSARASPAHPPAYLIVTRLSHDARRSRARWLTSLVALVLSLATIVGTAAAHTALTGAVPARGSTVREPPSRLALSFTEEVSLAVSRVQLFGPDSAEIALGALRHPGDSARTLVADVGATLRPGRYIVRWQVAGEDGHPVHGEYGFVLAADSLAAAVPPPSGEAVARGLVNFDADQLPAMLGRRL